MAFDAGTVTVNTGGTAEQITSDLASTAVVRASLRIISIEITPRPSNTGDAMYVGTSSVTTSYGKRIPKGASHTINFEPTTEKFSNIYMDADSGGDKADWVVIFQTGTSA